MDRRQQIEHSVRWIQRLKTVLLIAAVAVIVLEHGGRQLEAWLGSFAPVFAAVTMALLLVGLRVRYVWDQDRAAFLQERRGEIAVATVWFVGLFGACYWGFWRDWSEFCTLASATLALARSLRLIAAGRINPALVFVGSFAALITLGSVLLMLPACHTAANANEGLGETALAALFTSTSACCVTGLTIVDTGSYWSRTGQVVILSLFQIGGLGIMSFGAFFALGSKRGLQLKESVFLGSLYEADQLHQIRRLVVSVLLFTVIAELIGTLLLTGLWPEKPWSERLFFGLFHAVSAFCNAGFSLMPANLEGIGHRWQIWGVLAPLIIVGGLGFAVLNNTSQFLFRECRRCVAAGKSKSAPRMLMVTTRLVLVTTTALLLLGMASVWALEARGVLRTQSLAQQAANSWFQSVTFRTAGFNSVPQDKLSPGTKLLGIGLMFIGGSPGSTAGGVKTVATALSFLALFALLRGRDRVEVWHRRIPDSQVQRAAMIITLAAVIVLTGTFLVVQIENQPGKFLDHLFEVVSACATVGLSTVNSATLQPASKLVLVACMFIGRVGPITLLLAVGGSDTARPYDYPKERVMLG